MRSVTDYFGCMVFDDKAMRLRLPTEIYEAMKKTIRDGKRLDIAVANAVADAMKEWAVENGATHYTHWPRGKAALAPDIFHLVQAGI